LALATLSFFGTGMADVVGQLACTVDRGTSPAWQEQAAGKEAVLKALDTAAASLRYFYVLFISVEKPI